MRQSFGEIEFECGMECGVEHSVKMNVSGAVIHIFNIEWDYSPVNKETKIKLRISKDALEHMYYWNPDCGMKRSMPLGWIPGKRSMTSISAPVSCIYNGNGKNIFTCALSEVKETVELKTAIIDDKYFGMEVNIDLYQYKRRGHLELKLLIDETQIPMYEALDNVRKWWEEECGLKPMSVPEAAKDTMYSYWYSFQQAIYQEEVLAEAEKASEFGFKTVILDDGWQTDGERTRYAYAGDWQVHKNKFSDFARTIDSMHDMGLKVLLWVAIPYLGEKSRLWSKYKNKTLWHDKDALAAVLDPRYPEIREYIINTLKRLIKDYKLDGFKLDFIDLFYEADGSVITEEMDYSSVQEAVDRLMVDIKDELVNINAEILIEFRQRYIGPNMRKYGNMFRVGDCPDDYLSNRVGTLDLRLLSGNTAVHSDMLVWNVNEAVETAALQIINIIFATMQFSCRLSEVSEEHIKMVKFWMDFMKEHKDVLLNCPIMVEEPQLLYTSARTESKDKAVIAVYSNDKCITLNDKIKKNIILNGTQKESVIVELLKDGTYEINVRDCSGVFLRNEQRLLKAGLECIQVPVAGIVEIKKFMGKC